MVRPMMSRLPSLLLVACVAARRRPVAVPRLGTPHPTSANCTLHRVSQNLDHFDFTTNATFEQRVFVHADHWAPGGPIFLYCGNEDDVTLYVNATGLMWEHAAAFGAMLVFVERRSASRGRDEFRELSTGETTKRRHRRALGRHRYYGATLPFGAASFEPEHLRYLSHEQALADLVNALRRIKATYGAENAKTVAFGGSYGGMLAAWLRMKYPAAVIGAVAASAPILAFDGDGFDGEAYWEVVTRDATAAAGAAPACAANVREAFSALFRADRDDLARIFRTCGPVADRSRLALLALFAFDTMAMGNYPYESTYLTHGEVALPAFPVRAACEHLAGPLDGDEALLAALAAAAGVFYNASGALACNELPADVEEDGIWDWQYCTETLPQETYFPRDGVRDMFWPAPANDSWVDAHCEAKYGVAPRRRWIADSYGGRAGVAAATNIVFSNGALDPWSAGGVADAAGGATETVRIDLGAHHLDLMFMDDADPPCATFARQVEARAIQQWADAARAAHASGELS